MDQLVRPSLYPNRPRKENPSFSSTLLDSICRSLDERFDFCGEEEPMRVKQINPGGGFSSNDEEMANLRRVCLIEKWMEKKAITQKETNHRKTVPDFQKKPPSVLHSQFLKSSSSSSDSSSGGGFSSSEAESISTPSVTAPLPPKPIRTKRENADNVFDKCPQRRNCPRNERTKSKTSDLKKVKQPISPGGRLTCFLNSLFTVGSPRKAEVPSSSTTTCSFSRSCLSKNPSSKMPSDRIKRSVRFLDEHKLEEEKSNTLRNLIKEEIKFQIMEKRQGVVQEAARDVLKNYKTKMEHGFDLRVENELDDEDDGDSCTSSDLFELDNLSSIGVEKYGKELPVYESTCRLNTNRAIVNGLSLYI